MPPNKKKKQKKGNPKKASFNPIRKVNRFFKDRHPIFKFLAGFIGCMVLFYLFYYSSFYKNILEGPLLGAQAKMGNATNAGGEKSRKKKRTHSGEEF